MLRRYINFMKKHPLITAVIAIVYAMICLKSLSTTTYFQALVVRTLLCGAMHGVYDFLVSMRMGLFNPEGPLSVEYVVEGEAGKASIIIYAVTTAIELLILWIVWRKVGKKIDYQAMRETW